MACGKRSNETRNCHGDHSMGVQQEICFVVVVVLVLMHCMEVFFIHFFLFHWLSNEIRCDSSSIPHTCTFGVGGLSRPLVAAPVARGGYTQKSSLYKVRSMSRSHLGPI